MRIERLTFERYGRFADRTLTFRRDAPLHVVMGANESGKTTALSAITDLLFGFGQRTPYDFLHEGKALRLGADLRMADGHKLSFRRRKGNKNTLIDDGEHPLPDDLLAPLIGSVTRESFTREFGLTADDLRKGGEDLLKADGRLAETLAAGSAGLTALSRLREKLAAEADQLFTPRKSSGKDFYVSLDAHEQANRKLRDAIVTAEALEAAEAAAETARTELHNLSEAHDKAGRELRRLERCQRTRNRLAELDQLNLKLRALRELPMAAAQVVADWRTAWMDDQQAAKDLRQLDESDAHDRAEIAGLGIDENLLSCGAEIDLLRERLGAVRKALDDLPRRAEARRIAIAELDELARRLGMASHGVLLARRPADPALEQVRALTEARTLANARLRDAEDRHVKAVRNRDALAAESQHPVHPADPAIFRQRLESVADVPGDVRRVREDGAACDEEQRAIAEAARALNPSISDFDALAGLPLPGEADISGHAAALDDMARAQRKAMSDRDDAERSIAEASSEIERLARGGVSATRADLHAARTSRDAGLESLNAALDGDAAARHSRFMDLRSLSRGVDDITDQLLGDTDRAARKQLAEDRLAAATVQMQLAAAQSKDLDARKAGLEAAWLALWNPAKLQPRTPAEMARWRQQVAALSQRRKALHQRRSSIEALRTRLHEHRAMIARLMTDHGRTPDAAQPVDLLYREASAWLNDLQAAWAGAREAELKRNNLEKNIADAEAEVSRARGEISRVDQDWPAAVAAIGLGAGASVAEAQAALKIWQGVEAPRQAMEEAAHRVASIEADIASFNADVAVLTGRLSPDLAGGDAQTVLNKLGELLREARDAAVRRGVLQRAIAVRQATRAGLSAKRSGFAAVLAEASHQLGLGDSSLFGQALEQLEERQALEAEIAGATAALIESGDGLDEAALRSEQAGLDPDAVPGEIERLKLLQADLLKAIPEASSKVSEAQRLCDDLAKGRDAPRAARERAEAAAELLSISRRWLASAAAARLAARAIERHRAAVQDPVLLRAGKLFAAATADGFTGLVADYDDADQVTLVAMRGSGERVAIRGLSEGTRDQLFLALRLALLELRNAEPLPFIADDLLSSFDDERTLRMLDLLSRFGRKTQTIVFTHHAHVAELARSAVAGADVITL